MAIIGVKAQRHWASTVREEADDETAGGGAAAAPAGEVGGDGWG